MWLHAAETYQQPCNIRTAIEQDHRSAKEARKKELGVSGEYADQNTWEGEGQKEPLGTSQSANCQPIEKEARCFPNDKCRHVWQQSERDDH